jgi:hypothetical protein
MEDLWKGKTSSAITIMAVDTRIRSRELPSSPLLNVVGFISDAGYWIEATGVP